MMLVLYGSQNSLDTSQPVALGNREYNSFTPSPSGFQGEWVPRSSKSPEGCCPPKAWWPRAPLSAYWMAGAPNNSALRGSCGHSGHQGIFWGQGYCPFPRSLPGGEIPRERRCWGPFRDRRYMKLGRVGSGQRRIISYLGSLSYATCGPEVR